MFAVIICCKDRINYVSVKNSRFKKVVGIEHNNVSVIISTYKYIFYWIYNFNIKFSN